MHLAPGAERRPTATPLDEERARRRDGLDELVASVISARPRLIDAWEAAALLESIGYTDGRLQQELGFSDTRAAGTYVYERTREQPASFERWTPQNLDRPFTIVVRSAASTLIYAVPWLAVFVGQIVRPDAMRLPTRVAPALALALMFSLVASGGFVQAIVRRGEFYVGLQQVEMARHVVRALLRIGIVFIVAVALAAMLVGWYFKLFAWSALVLGADGFIIMSVLWMVCGIFAIRQQQWRIAVAFVIGFVVFGAMRAGGAEVVTAQLAAVASVLAVAALQMRWVFGRGATVPGLPPAVAMPRLSVLAYWTVPYFWYGTVYFAFLFADRLSAGTAGIAISGAPFGVPAEYNFGMELALLTLLVAASGVEVAGALFSRAFANEAVRPLIGDARSLASALRRHHGRAIALTIGVFVVSALTIGQFARRLLPAALTPYSSFILLVGDLGYACLAVALVNALVLFATRHAWTVVRQFTAALAINLASGYVLGHAFVGFHAVDGLLLGSVYFAAASTIAVRQMLHRPDYAYAVA